MGLINYYYALALTTQSNLSTAVDESRHHHALKLSKFNRKTIHGNAGNRTWGSWVRNVNATSVLCDTAFAILISISILLRQSRVGSTKLLSNTLIRWLLINPGLIKDKISFKCRESKQVLLCEAQMPSLGYVAPRS